MSIAKGKSALQRLFNWVPRNGWGVELKRIRQKIVDAHRERSEILDGGLLTAGTITATELVLSMGECKVMVLGRMGTIAAVTTDDFLDDATTGVEQPIFADGSDASDLDLDTDETAYVTLIVTNSDGAGDAIEDDNGAFTVLAVVAGTASTYADQSAHLSSSEIQAALDASDSVHDGVTGWCHLAQILYDENSGSPQTTIVMNRNNAVSEA